MHTHSFFSRIPPKSKKLSDFEKGDKIIKDTNVPASAHEAFIIRRQTKSGGWREYVYKPHNESTINPIELAQIEVFNGICYRLLLGERAPKMAIVYDDAEIICGVYSKKIADYYSFHQYHVAREKIISPKKLLKLGAGYVFAACYVEEENDAHGGNMGMGTNAKGETICFKIDNDQSTFSITYVYHASLNKSANLEGRKIEEVYFIPIEELDIDEFPELRYAHPKNWPSYGDGFNVRGLKNNPEFMQQVYFIFLKKILFDKEVYTAIAQATIASAELAEKLVNNKVARLEDLHKKLLANPKFRKYVIEHPAIIDLILAQLEEYNLDYKKDKFDYLRIVTSKIRENFKTIMQECLEKNVNSDLSSPVINQTIVKPKEKLNIGAAVAVASAGGSVFDYYQPKVNRQL